MWTWSTIDTEIFTETETLQSESTAPTIFNEFVEVIGSQEWYEARFVVEHGRRTANLGLRHVGAHLGESLEAVFDKEVGSCFVKAHFKDNEITENFLNRLYQNLELAEKPKKASRYIPEQLETKLLCDSMHLCNVCCEPDIILHHIIPVENGGSTVEENLVVLCLKHHHYAHARFSLTKSFQPQHLREYKRRHLEWVASRGTKGTGEMPVTSE